MYKGFLTAALSVSVTVTASTLSPQDMIKLHVQRAQNMTGTAHKSSSGVTAGKRGSLVYLDNGENCDKDITSGFGFTLGECVVRQNEGHGVKYANCFYDTGNVVFTFTECSDKLCQEDCVDYMMINSKQCVYGPEPYNGQIVCSPNVDAYNNYEDLTLSSRLVSCLLVDTTTTTIYICIIGYSPLSTCTFL